MQKNVSSQSLTLLAIDTTTGAPKTGDSANMLFYYSLDDGTVTVVSGNSGVPTEVDSTNAKGLYKIALTQGETNGNKILFSGKSSTSNIILVPALIYTRPANFQARVIDSSGLGDANVVKVGPTGAGAAQTARDIGASVLLSTGTGTGQLDFTSGIVKANLAQILGTALTETAGQIAAAFKKFFDKATPTGTINSIPDAVAGASGGLFIAGSNAATTANITGNLTGNVTGSVGSVTGAVGSVTGAVGSVTGNVGGNVTGSVGSVASGGIAAASFAAGAVNAAAIADGAIDRATFAADTGLQSIRSNTAQAGASTSITLDASASASNSFYVNDLIILTGGTGAGQARFITAYVGSTKVASVSAWTTNPDNTTTFAIMAFDSVPGATAPTTAQITAAIFTDLMSGTDFNTAGSFGALIKSDIDAAISSRMATYTQPTGFLAATFPSGTVANTTNITAGTVTTATNLTTNNDKTGYALSSGGVQAIWDALVSALTTVNSIGKRLVDYLTGDIYARLGAPAGASVSADIAAQTLYSSRVVVRGTVGSASTTTSIVTSAFSPAGVHADQFKGAIVVWDTNTTTAALRGQRTDITASSASATPTLTVTALTDAPVSGDTFSVL